VARTGLAAAPKPSPTMAAQTALRVRAAVPTVLLRMLAAQGTVPEVGLKPPLAVPEEWPAPA
jgi:hypothetical protein